MVYLYIINMRIEIIFSNQVFLLSISGDTVFFRKIEFKV